MEYKLVFPCHEFGPHYRPRVFKTQAERDAAFKALNESDKRKAYKQDGDGPYFY